MLFTSLFIISCGEDTDPITEDPDNDPMEEMNDEMCNENQRAILPIIQGFEYFDYSIAGLLDLDRCDIERPAMAAALDVTASIQFDIFGDPLINIATPPAGGGVNIDSHYSAMICCGLPDELNVEGQRIVFSGVFRDMSGAAQTANLVVVNGDTLRTALGGQTLNVLHLLDVRAE